MSAAARLRSAQPGDAARLAHVQVEAWRDTYPTLLPPAYLTGQLNPSSTAARRRRALASPRPGQHVVVCELPAIGIVGYASGGPVRDPALGPGGEVYELYLLTDHRERGLGRRLLAELIARLVADGHRAATVEVLAGNPARYFYEAMGARAVAQHQHAFAGQSLPAVIYAWKELAALARLAGGGPP